MGSPDIVVYTTAWCSFCHMVKRLLDAKGVTYQEIDVDSSPDLRRDVARRSGRTTLPQVFIEGSPRGGYDDLAALELRGELDELLRSSAPD